MWIWIGDITFVVTQWREGGLNPSAFEKGMHSERAFMFALAEIYTQAVSTHRVKAVTEGQCRGVTSVEGVFETTTQQDRRLQEWWERLLVEIN